MTIDRSQWEPTFRSHQPLRWACGSCHASRYQLVEETLLTHESQASKNARVELAWDPDWEEGVFACLLRCPTCREVSIAAGPYRVVEYGVSYRDAPEPEPDYAKDLSVRFFSAPPHIIHPPPKVPKAVTDHLEVSFGLYWQEPEAAANRVRASIENLLTHLRVPQTTRTSQGRRRWLSLHERVERLPESQRENRTLLMAVKWIGNSGSHGDSVTCDDLLDGYQLLDHVFNDLFRKPGVRAQVLARAINRRGGPRSRRR
jgi:hypothetical protein